MKISVDTTALTELASAMRAANEQIVEAVGLLNKTTEHNDWGCKERVVINENTQAYKREAQMLMEASSAFSGCVTNAVNSFLTKESSLSTFISAAEAIISGAIGIPIMQPLTWIGDKMKELINQWFQPQPGEPTIWDMNGNGYDLEGNLIVVNPNPIIDTTVPTIDFSKLLLASAHTGTDWNNFISPISVVEGVLQDSTPGN